MYRGAAQGHAARGRCRGVSCVAIDLGSRARAGRSIDPGYNAVRVVDACRRSESVGCGASYSRSPPMPTTRTRTPRSPFAIACSFVHPCSTPSILIFIHATCLFRCDTGLDFGLRPGTLAPSAIRSSPLVLSRPCPRLTFGFASVRPTSRGSASLIVARVFLVVSLRSHYPGTAQPSCQPVISPASSPRTVVYARM